MPINNYIAFPLIAIILLVGIGLLVNNNKKKTENATNSVAPYDAGSVLSAENEKTPTNKENAMAESSSTTNPTPTATINRKKPTTSPMTISFVNLPQQIRSGESFTVQWKVDGPNGLQGEDTKLEVSYNVESNDGNSSASSSSESSQSFGSFTTPQTFDSNFSFGGTPGTINVKATARINGQILTTHDSIQLTN